MVVHAAMLASSIATNTEAISVTTFTFTAFGSHPYPDPYTEVLCSLHQKHVLISTLMQIALGLRILLN